MTKYRVDVLATGETRWANNALTFDTEGEAAAYGRDLWFRWTSAELISVVPTTVPEREPYVDGEREVYR